MRKNMTGSIDGPRLGNGRRRSLGEARSEKTHQAKKKEKKSADMMTESI